MVKYTRHQGDEIRIWTDRAHWEAEHGRVKLAIARLQELADEFPQNPHVAYDQGLLWCHHVGNGHRAREFFLMAARMADEQNVKGTRWFAARYLAILSSSPDEARSWVDIILSLAPRRHRDRKRYRLLMDDLNSGEPYGHLMWLHADKVSSDGEPGFAAAIAEIALELGKESPTFEVSVRRGRAEWLRMLDQKESQQRLPEIFPSSDRLALQEAVAELERALQVDPHDAALWNFKAAWCELLGRHLESIEAADKAIALRPVGYPRPWINKAMALYSWERDEEALSCARKGLEVANATREEFPDAFSDATRAIDTVSKPRQTPTLADFEPIMRHAVGVALKNADQLSPKRLTTKFLGNGIRARIRVTKSDRAISYVPMMAQLLSDLGPEVAFSAVLTIAQNSIPDFALCMNAAMYLAADTDGVIQRDATRFIILNVFFHVASSVESVRNIYRTAIFVVCESAVPPLSRLDAFLRFELANFGAALPDLIANQESLTPGEEAGGMQVLLAHFTGDPHEFEIDASQIGFDVANDPDMGGITRLLKYVSITFRGLWLLIRGPARPRRRR